MTRRERGPSGDTRPYSVERERTSALWSWPGAAPRSSTIVLWRGARPAGGRGRRNRWRGRHVVL